MRTLWGLPLLVGLLGAVQAAALPVLSEVFYDAVGSDDGFVFVEIYGQAGTNLEGLTVDEIAKLRPIKLSASGIEKCVRRIRDALKERLSAPAGRSG